VEAASIDVRKAEESDVPRLAQLLTTAFWDDPGDAWLFPDADERPRLQTAFYGCAVRAYLPCGEVYTTDGLDAVAVWIPPDVDEEVEDALMGSLFDTIPEAYHPRMRQVFAALDEVQPDEPHYHLLVIATAPERRSQGVGSALMRPVLERCDRAGTGAYLEASNEPNRRLYARHGFEVIGELEIGGGVRVWPMWRKPR
jgi:ribosomal protein S18 acetylase RimI-like enzyme